MRRIQVSWLAARAIRYRFIRLFFPSLPEKHSDHSGDLPFPRPEQVAQSSVVELRSAGLSGSKATYILDLAARFADGRLSSERLVKMTDEEVMEQLIAVRGIGKWTVRLISNKECRFAKLTRKSGQVEMFSIFSLRRPDILPAGDLGEGFRYVACK
jgi:DNA-3-methyladenine glycosylase II